MDEKIEMTPLQFKKIQRLKKMSNEEMAEALRVSVSLIEKLRTGKRRITEHMAFVVCELLK